LIADLYRIYFCVRDGMMHYLNKPFLYLETVFQWLSSNCNFTLRQNETKRESAYKQKFKVLILSKLFFLKEAKFSGLDLKGLFVTSSENKE